jgi:hypothetical protein
MADTQCRVTVVGGTKRVDVALPAGASIGEYVGSVAQLCAEPVDDTFPAAWSLGLPDGRALSPALSLNAAGITDGQILYLRDLTDGEYDEPVVLEVEEVIADAADRVSGPRWTPSTAAAATLVVSAAWLAAATITWLAVRSAHDQLSGPLALVAGLIPALVAWTGRSSRLNLRLPVRLVLALTSVPCLAVSGWFVGAAPHDTDSAGALIGLAIGAIAGALVAVGAVPGAATLSVAVLTVLAAAVTGTLAGLDVRVAQGAAVAALLSYGLLVLAPAVAGRLAAAWSRLTGDEDPDAAVMRAQAVAIGGTFVGSAALAASVAVAASTGSRFAIGVGACLSVAALLRAGAHKYAVEAIPVIVAGLAGLLAIALTGPRAIGGPGWLPTLACLTIGVAVLIAGAWLAFRHVAFDGGSGAVKWPVWARMTAALFSIAAVPLTAGAFGLFRHLISLGRHV